MKITCWVYLSSWLSLWPRSHLCTSAPHSKLFPPFVCACRNELLRGWPLRLFFRVGCIQFPAAVCESNDAGHMCNSNSMCNSMCNSMHVRVCICAQVRMCTCASSMRMRTCAHVHVHAHVLCADVHVRTVRMCNSMRVKWCNSKHLWSACVSSRVVDRTTPITAISRFPPCPHTAPRMVPLVAHSKSKTIPRTHNPTTVGTVGTV